MNDLFGVIYPFFDMVQISSVGSLPLSIWTKYQGSGQESPRWVTAPGLLDSWEWAQDPSIGVMYGPCWEPAAEAHLSR